MVEIARQILRSPFSCLSALANRLLPVHLLALISLPDLRGRGIDSPLPLSSPSPHQEVPAAGVQPRDASHVGLLEGGLQE